ncbi:yqaJ domain-containing protein [Nephila pilipes]|uniref:YqaJ domain-containing protein n=1 Tax=Nephila pilipes TaxID=299642 RepID=A0A8X6TQX5_NEPPI|nr:yqaJ domain-containing protein [Nephila pilipes]
MERKDHACWKNWRGPSTAVESDAVVEGLLYQENVHHIRCTRLVGDGDANTIAKCKERAPYGGRILKVECANHVVRSYGRAIQKLQLGNTTRFSGQTGIKARKLLKQKMMKLIIGARNVIKNTLNNPAEAFLSQVCKISGGKRINFSKSGSFNRRANITILAFQSPAQQYHGKAYKIIANKNPSTPLNKFLLTRRNKYLKRLQRKKLFPNIKKFQPKQNTGDSNYGDCVEKLDMPTEIFERITENLLSKLKVQTNSDIEFETKGQTTSERWSPKTEHQNRRGSPADTNDQNETQRGRPGRRRGLHRERHFSRIRLQGGRRGKPLLGKAPEGGREAMLLGGSGGDHPQ